MTPLRPNSGEPAAELAALAEWLDDRDRFGALMDLLGLWVQGKRSSSEVAEKLIQRGYVDKFPGAAAPRPDVALDVEGLRELSDAATPGPWRATTEGSYDQKHAAAKVFLAVMARRLDDNPEVEFSDLSWVRTQGDDWLNVALIGNGKDGPENAEFIAACVNYVRAALAAAADKPNPEPARDATDEWLADMDLPPDHPSRSMWGLAALAEIDRLRAALAAPGGEALRAALEAMVRQFAYWSDGAGGYWTGGLSALEEAFDALGWDDPHPAPEARCDEPGCMKQSSMGTPTMGGYRRTCWDHHPEGLSADQRVEWTAYQREHPGTSFSEWAAWRLSR